MILRKLGIAAVLLLTCGGLVWGLTGGFDRVVESRVQSALQKQGIPEPIANCMARTLVAELNYNQLRSLESLAPEGGEAPVPRNWIDIRQRLAQIDDPRAVVVAGRSAVTCLLEGVRGGLPG